MMSEIWKPVVGFEKQYEVSTFGRVRSLDREVPMVSRYGKPYLSRRQGRLLRPGRATAGHLTVSLERCNSRLVHHLVLEAFVGSRPSNTECRHLDGDPSNNHLSNLQWGTRSRNSQDKKWHKSTKLYRLSPVQILEIKTRLKNPHFGLGAELAARYGVAESTISAIKHGKFHNDVVVT